MHLPLLDCRITLTAQAFAPFGTMEYHNRGRDRPAHDAPFVYHACIVVVFLSVLSTYVCSRGKKPQFNASARRSDADEDLRIVRVRRANQKLSRNRSFPVSRSGCPTVRTQFADAFPLTPEIDKPMSLCRRAGAISQKY